MEMGKTFEHYDVVLIILTVLSVLVEEQQGWKKPAHAKVCLNETLHN